LPRGVRRLSYSGAVNTAWPARLSFYAKGYGWSLWVDRSILFRLVYDSMFASDVVTMICEDLKFG